MTVLIAAYNVEPFLGAAIDSALAQTFPDFELLVVDDASTDRSREVVERYRDPRVRLLRNASNSGASAARNRGLAAIATEYVAPLDGDDLWLPQRLARQVAYLDAHPDVAVVGAQGTVIDVAGRTIDDYWRPTTELGIRWCRIWQSPVIHSSALIRRAIVWDELGGYDEQFRIGEDFELWRRVARKYPIHNLAEPLVAYRFRPGSLTGTRNPAREAYFERKALSIAENLREILQWDDVPPRAVEQWLAIENPREIAGFLERCAARFASIHGEDGDVARHHAELLLRVLRRWPSFWLWTKIWRRHRKTALRALVRAAARARRGRIPESA